MKYLLLVFSMLSFHAISCENTGERHTHGEQPLASKLYEAAKNTELGAWEEGEFRQEHFYYLGQVQSGKQTLYVTYIDTAWGASSCRVTLRLIFFTEDFIQFAQYYAIQKPQVIGNTLDFPQGEKAKIRIDISQGLPEHLNDGNDYFPISKYPFD